MFLKSQVTLPGLNAYGCNAEGDSGILDVLGADRVAEFTAHPASVRSVLYAHPRLRHTGVQIEPGHPVNSAQLRQECTPRFAWRIDGDPSLGSRVFYADKYSGTEGTDGSGRFAFPKEHDNAAVDPCDRIQTGLKGIGVTPLVGKADAGHSNGKAIGRGGVLETINLEILGNLFAEDGPQNLAVLGLNQYIDRGGSRRDQVAIIVRGGRQMRPAHTIEQSVYAFTNAEVFTPFSDGLHGEDAKLYSKMSLESAGDTIHGAGSTLPQGGTIKPEVFFKMAHVYGVLLWRFDEELQDFVPDVPATFRGLIEVWAHRSAEQFRWGVMHGTPSAGNWEFNGAFLDSLEVLSNPRRASFFSVPYTYTSNEGEIRVSAHHLKMMYQSLALNLSDEEKSRYGMTPDFDIEGEYNAAFNKELGTMMTRALGLKYAAADDVVAADPELVKTYAELAYDLALRANPGVKARAVDFDKVTPISGGEELAEHSVLDVFSALRDLPAFYFKNPEADTHALAAEALTLMKPHYYGEVRGQVKRLFYIERNITAKTKERLKGNDAALRQLEDLSKRLKALIAQAFTHLPLVDQTQDLEAVRDQHQGALKAMAELFRMVLLAYAGFVKKWAGFDIGNIVRLPQKLKNAYSQQAMVGMQKRRDKVVDDVTFFASLYHNMMDTAVREGLPHYDGEEAMRTAVTERAHYENIWVPVTGWWKLHHEIIPHTFAYDDTGVRELEDPHFYTRYIRENIEPGLRNVERLIARGDVATLADGRVEMERETWNNTTYAVRVNPTNGERDFVVRLMGESHFRHPHLIYSFDGGKTRLSISGRRVVMDGQEQWEFVIPVHKSLNAVFSGAISESEESSGYQMALYPYAFTVPDDRDFQKLMSQER